MIGQGRRLALWPHTHTRRDDRKLWMTRTKQRGTNHSETHTHTHTNTHRQRERERERERERGSRARNYRRVVGYAHPHGIHAPPIRSCSLSISSSLPPSPPSSSRDAPDEGTRRRRNSPDDPDRRTPTCDKRTTRELTEIAPAPGGVVPPARTGVAAPAPPAHCVAATSSPPAAPPRPSLLS